MKLSVPYNHKTDLLDALSAVSAHLAYLFLPFHPETSLSARAFKGQESAEEYASELRSLAEWCEQNGLGMNLLANAPAWAVDTEKVARTVDDLRNHVSKLKTTFADMRAARATKQLLPWMEVGVSCLADVQTPIEAMWWRQEAGATHLAVSREINRRPEMIKALAKTGMSLSLVAFDDCVPGCQAKSRHFIPPSAGDRYESLGRFVAACDPANVQVRKSRPWLLAQKEILPGHLKHLKGMVNEIKISGRNMNTAQIMRRIELYLQAESLTHPNGFYSEPPEAWKHIATCDRNCPECQWCEENLIWADHAEETRDENRTSFELDVPRGGSIKIWIEPVDPNRPPMYTVDGLGVYFRELGSMDPKVLEAILEFVAKELGRSGTKISGEDFWESLRKAELPGNVFISDEP